MQGRCQIVKTFLSAVSILASITIAFGQTLPNTHPTNSNPKPEIITRKIFLPSRLMPLQSMGGLSGQYLRVWNKVRPSIVTLETNGQVSGLAACIDSSGLFIAGRLAVRERFVKAILPNDKIITLHWIKSDSLSNLVLLQSMEPLPKWMPPLATVKNEPQAPEPVIAALIEGPARAEIALADIVARISSSAPALSMDELCIEAPIQRLAGTLYFDQDGRLAGILGAWLGEPEQRLLANPLTSSKNVALQAINKKNVLGKSNEATSNGLEPKMNARLALPTPAASVSAEITISLSRYYGPQGLIVAYSPSVYLFHQVVSGFLSPSHQPLHPYFGASCIDASSRNMGVFGAVVVQIYRGSPADKDGLKVGDLILAVDGKTIENQVQLVRSILHCQVGDQLQIQFLRQGRLNQITLTIGALSKKILESIPTR